MKRYLLVAAVLVAACHDHEKSARRRFQHAVGGDGRGHCVTEKYATFCSDGQVLVICTGDDDTANDDADCITVRAPAETTAP